MVTAFKHILSSRHLTIANQASTPVPRIHCHKPDKNKKELRVGVSYFSQTLFIDKGNNKTESERNNTLLKTFDKFMKTDVIPVISHTALYSPRMTPSSSLIWGMKPSTLPWNSGRCNNSRTLSWLHATTVGNGPKYIPSTCSQSYVRNDTVDKLAQQI